MDIACLTKTSQIHSPLFILLTSLISGPRCASTSPYSMVFAPVVEVAASVTVHFDSQSGR